MPRYGEVPDERDADVLSVISYAFDAQSGRFDPDEDAGVSDDYYQFGSSRALYADDGTVLATTTTVPFEARVRDAWLDLAGLTGVASRPEHRRQGHVATLVEHRLAEWREEGYLLSALRPFDEGFYARLGWEVGCRYRTATLDPAVLGDAAPDAGRFERVQPDAYGRIEPVYEAWLAGTTLATRRDETWWTDRVFALPHTDLDCTAWVDPAGDVRGYLLYHRDEDRLVVDEFAPADPVARRHLLRFLGRQADRVAEVSMTGHRLDRVVDAVRARHGVDVSVQAGQMVRLVDVPRALEAVAYPGVADATLAVAVADDQAPWNDATFAVEVADGTMSVAATEAAPDVSLSVGTLSALFVGYRSVEDAVAVGDVEVHDPGAGETLAALFPERPTYLPESF